MDGDNQTQTFKDLALDGDDQAHVMYGDDQIQTFNDLSFDVDN